MPFLAAARFRLGPRFTSSTPLLRNGNTSTRLDSALCRSRTTTQQTAIFVSCTNSSYRRIPLLRSPLQWSHVIHHIRKPTALSTSNNMGQDSKISSGQARTHMGHSHSHGHHHGDNTYLTSKNKNDPGVRITRIGLYVNLGMAIAKGAGGIVFNSQALTADAVHALTDLVSDITTLATISYSLRPASSRFPMGYGKIESLGALGVSALLLSGGIMIGLQALMVLSQQFFPEIAHLLSHVGIFEHAHHHGHSHGDADLGPNINAAWLAGGSIIVKEWLYRATIKVAREKRSSVLASNAYHHRVDSLTAFVALLTITASNFLTNAQWLDPVGGLIISGMIIQAGWVNTKTALFELSDVSFDNEIKEKVQKAAALALKEDVGSTAEIKGVQGVKSGQNILVEVEVAAPGDWTVSKTDQVESAIRKKIGAKVRGVRRVVVRFTSDDDNATEPFAQDFIDKADDSEPEESSHEHDHDHDHSHDSQANGRAAAPFPNTNGSVHKRK